MFTGLVEDLGEVAALSSLPRGSGLRMRLRAGLLDEVMPLGASLAVDGACLTVVTASPGQVEVELGPETLSRTTLGALKVGDRVHLERALRLGDRLGGHLVSGHVDGIGTIESSARRGDSWDVAVQTPPALSRYIIEKGAITIDGISLTVNTIDPTAGLFSVSLVPYTQSRVTLSRKAVGARVNLEVDLIGKYVERLLAPHLAQISPSGSAAAAASKLTMDKLKENGFV
jgi:riboflavin synthase